METWRAIPGFESLYEVSDFGKVRSLDRSIEGARRPTRRNGQVRRTFFLNSGYEFLQLSKGGKKYQKLVHRLVLEAFIGPCPPDMEACHTDGNRTNNRLDNLRWDTRKSNHRDKRRHGTSGAKPDCPRGHAYVKRNLVPSSKRGSSCLACSRGAAFIRNAQRDGRPHGTLAEESDRYYRQLMA